MNDLERLWALMFVSGYYHREMLLNCILNVKTSGIEVTQIHLLMDLLLKIDL